MEMGKVISQFSQEEQKKLAAAQSAEELSKIAAEFRKHLDREKAEAIFAVLYPVRGKEPIDERELEMILGGTRPQQTMPGDYFIPLSEKKHL